MDLFFALRGGQIGRSVMWSNGAILPILGIICILSIAGVILIYSYNAAFEAFRKSLREKTARYLAIFLVLMELCGMTYVDLYHTHLLGGLGKTAAKSNRLGSHVPSAAQKISRLPLESPVYKVFQDIEKYQQYGDSPYTGVSLNTLKADIEEVLEDKKLDPDIKQELRGIHTWVESEVRGRDIRRQSWRTEEDAQWEKLKNTTDSRADAMAENRLLQWGSEMSQEQLEDCLRTILLAGGDSKFAVTQETMDYVRGIVGDRLSPEDYARIANEADAILRASRGAAPANPAAGALVPQNSSSTSGPQTSPVPTIGQPNTNAGQLFPPVGPSTGPHPGPNAPAGSNPSQYHPSEQLNGGLPKNPGLFGRTLDSAWGATQFSGLPLTAPTHLVGGVSNAANTWHPYLQGLAAKNGWKGVVGRTVEPAVGALSKLPQKGVPYGKWSDLTPAQRLLHIGAAGGNLALGGYHTLGSDLGRAAGAGVRAVENPSLGNAGNFVHQLWNTATQPYKNMVNTVVDGVINKTNGVVGAGQKIQGDSNEGEQQ